MAAAPLAGCEQLCGPGGVGVFCPQSESNPLNDPPVVTGEIAFSPANSFDRCTNQVLVDRRIGFRLPEGSVFDPDGDPLLFEWDLDGDGEFEAGGPEAFTVYRTPGARQVSVRVSDFPQHLGAPGAVERTARVLAVDPARNRPPSAAFTAENRLPTAEFTWFPTTPSPREPVEFDASSSSDFEGPVVRYEWDLDGNGDFETDNGDEPVIEETYDTPGVRFVQLRVTDSVGARGTAVEAVDVREPSLVSALATASRTAAIPFSARVVGAADRGRRGELRRRGSRLSLRGVVGRGSMRARLLDPTGRDNRAERALARFLRAPWRTRLSFHFNRRTKRWTARGMALARAKRGRACLRVRLADRPGEHATGRLKLLGGRRAGARLRGSARLRFRLERDGSATALGELRARRASKRALPRSCRRLAGQSAAADLALTPSRRRPRRARG